MARIRTIKPEFFLHDELFELERGTGLPVRLTFIGLLTQCDREGRFKWRPLRLKAAVLPYDDVDMSRVLHALNTRGFIVKYANETGEYGVIPSFKKHQNINNKESPSDLPDISDCKIIKPSTDAGCDAITTREVHVSDAYQGERKEGKGKEGKEKNTLSDFGSNRTDEVKPASPEKPPAPENPEPEQSANRNAGMEPEPDTGQVAEHAGESDPPDKTDDRDKPGEPDPVNQAFEEIFWRAGLCKVGKVKACSAFRSKYRDWKKSTHGSPPEFASMLADDIRRRLSVGVFGVDKLHPATYLNQERWNDEIPGKTSVQPVSTPPSRTASTSWCTPAGDGSSEVFVNYAALERSRRGYGDR